MTWLHFLKQFEFTLISSVADHFKRQVNLGVNTFPHILKGLKELAIFKINGGMCDFLLLRSLERIVNLESDLDLSDNSRQNFFKFLRTNRAFEFEGIFTSERKFLDVLACFEDKND